jgi:hypothetical protein
MQESIDQLNQVNKGLMFLFRGSILLEIFDYQHY